MIIESFKTRGIGAPFKTREVEVDFRDIPVGSIVALVGDNGAGKSHLLELMGPGALFRELPSYRDAKAGRGEPIATHVPPDVRDAFVEVAYRLNGRPVLVRVEIDGKRNKTEAYVTADGQTRGPLLKEVDAELAKLFPSRSLMLAGPFACQGGFDGFFRLGPSDRKALFAELLGLGHLQELADAAGEHEKAALEALEKARDRVRAAQPALDRLTGLRAELGAIVQRIAIVTERHAQATAAHEAAVTALAEARENHARVAADAERTDAERARLTDAAASAAADVRRLDERIIALDAVLDGADAIRAAADKLPALDAALEEARAAERSIAGRLPDLEAGVATATAERDRLASEYRRLEAERVKVSAAVERIAAAGDLDAQLATAEAALAQESDVVADCDGRLLGLEVAADEEARAIAQRTQLETKRDALAPRRGLLDRIPGVDACGACPLTADARAAADALVQVEAELAQLPAIVGTPAADALRKCRQDRAAADTQRRHLEDRRSSLTQKLAALAGDRELATRAESLGRDLMAVLDAGSAAKATVDAYTAERNACRQDLDTAHVAIRRLEADRATQAGLAARLPEVSAAEGQRAELALQREAAAVTQAATTERLASLPVVDVHMAEADVAVAATVLRGAEQNVATEAAALRGQEQSKARFEGEIAALGDPDADRVRAQAEEAKQAIEAADWAVLQRALGNRGVQALLIDAAGPEVSALANDLLATCYTPRFQIALTTTQPTADGKGVKEVFDARILDAEAGRDGTRGSGGETALIDAALRLATVIVNTRRALVPTQTLFLDEATAALSPANAPCYVAMIRRAMELGGFHHCLLISHQQEVWESADVRLIVEDGQVRRWGADRRAA